MQMDISNVQKISFDFDGVFMRHFLNRHWTPASKVEKENEFKKTKLRKKFDVFVHAGLGLLRPEIKGSKTVLDRLTDKKLAITTSRRSTVKESTIKWLKKRDLYKYFEDAYFNEHNLAPHLFKEKVLKEKGFHLHIDDDYDTLIELTSRLPNVFFIYFNTLLAPKIEKENVATVFNWNELLDYFRNTGLVQKD